VTQPTDRNLLLGILAQQMDFLSRERFVVAFNEWVREKVKPLEEILLDQKALSPDVVPLLQALVAKHIELHSNSASASLQSLRLIDPLPESISLTEPDAQITLSYVARQVDSAEATRNNFASHIDSIRDQRDELSGAGSVARFQVIRWHAKGGIGEVLIARDRELDREVALKELQEPFADNQDIRSRFLLEAKLTGGLEHPGIVPVYALGQYVDGRPFYAMQFIHGDCLKDAVDRFYQKYRPSTGVHESELSVEFRQLLGRFVDVCLAIEYAHSRGVLHRDLKPANIMLGNYGETLVVDWGLAKVIRTSAWHSSQEATFLPDLGSEFAPTLNGSVIGTPAFMSPEQAAGNLDNLGPTSDVYSLGATFYFVLTGEPPFSGDDSRDLKWLLEQVQQGNFPRPRETNPRVPRSLEAICMKAMALHPHDRYTSPRMLAEDVERWLADEPIAVYRERAVERIQRLFRKSPNAVAFWGTCLIGVLQVLAGLMYQLGAGPTPIMLLTRHILVPTYLIMSWSLILAGVGAAVGFTVRRFTTLANPVSGFRYGARIGLIIGLIGSHTVIATWGPFSLTWYIRAASGRFAYVLVYDIYAAIWGAIFGAIWNCMTIINGTRFPWHRVIVIGALCGFLFSQLFLMMS
jgi:serine/threonine protein kinase